MKLRICLLLTAFALCAALPVNLFALPFSADTTTRESLRITAIGSSPTYAQLTGASKDLVFQERSDGNIFLAFSSLDASVDDFQGGGSQYNRCDNNGFYQIFWYDRASGRPGVCLSYNRFLEAGGNGDSILPRMGGADGDEGRYIPFQTTATNLDTRQYDIISVTPQTMLHDRKWELTWLTNSRCTTSGVAPDGATKLHALSPDGSKLLISSGAINQIDNLQPECTDSNQTVVDIFLRQGANCTEGALGKCRTEVLFDDFDLFAGQNTVDLLDRNSDNASMNSDQSTIVFETLATIPVRFLPDVRGNRDIYKWKGNRFSLISQTQLAIQSAITGATTVRNIGGAANGNSFRPRVDNTGKLISFDSVSTDLVLDNPGVTAAFKSTNGFSQVYLYSEDTGRIEMISITPSGAAGNGLSENAWISNDGRFIAFESTSTNLVNGLTTTAFRNIFLRDRVLNQTYIVTPGTGGNGLNADAFISHMGPTGLLIAFHTTASNANAPTTKGGADTNGVMDTYLAANSCPLDTDGDKTPDCLDTCPTDVNKTNPLQCGCGKAETDTDKDSVADCNDQCVDDKNKTIPGDCGCGKEDTDTDKDGKADCQDECPLDPTKTTPGKCGCGASDTQDTDGDGTPDCVDACPNDGSKTSAGFCGCGNSDSDGNGNGAADCTDPTANTEPSQFAKVRVVTNKSLPLNIRHRILLTAGDTYPGQITYNFAIKGPRNITRKSKTRMARFAELPPGSYTVSVFYSVGSGATAINSKTRTTTVQVGRKSDALTARR